MKKDKTDSSLDVKENQYRAVITYVPSKNSWKASVQRRVGISEWKRVRCGLKNSLFDTKEQAEMIARSKIKQEKQLDKYSSNPLSYVIYDD